MINNHQFFTFANSKEWREWLASYHDRATEAWLVIYKKGTGKENLSLNDAVEQALCFGWIDGKLKSVDSERYSLRFTPRRAGSVWSMRNIQRVESLIQKGLMTESGLAKVAEARLNGQWDAAVRREQTNLIPGDLEKALKKEKGAIEGFINLTESRKKQLLHWLMDAKRPETTGKRIEAIVREVTGQGRIGSY